MYTKNNHVIFDVQIINIKEIFFKVDFNVPGTYNFYFLEKISILILFNKTTCRVNLVNWLIYRYIFQNKLIFSYQVLLSQSSTGMMYSVFCDF